MSKTREECPVCGAGELRTRVNMEGGRARVRQVCAACGAEGPDAETTTSEFMADSTPAVDEAIEFWQDGYVLPETSDKVRQKIVSYGIMYLYHRVEWLEEQAERLRSGGRLVAISGALLAIALAFHVIVAHILA